MSSAFALLVTLVAVLISTPGNANERYAAAVLDATSGEVLFSRHADARRFPASLTKMMTLYLLFEDLERGRVSLATPLNVSPHAAAQPPTKLGLRPGETLTVEEAVKALVTNSANDVAVVVAENLEGTEDAFAARMTRAAHGLGMESTQFRNASGLHHPAQHTTARDMVVLGAALQVRFPSFYHYFSTPSFTFRGRLYKSHNRLIGTLEGADGIKTGYIRASGFNLVTSVRREGRKVIAVVLGGRTARTRDRHMEALIAEHMPKAAIGESYAAGLEEAVRRQARMVAAAQSASPGASTGISGRGADVSGDVAPPRYGIELGTLPSREAALQALEEARSLHQELLGDVTPVVKSSSREPGSARARFVGFEDFEAAVGACDVLRKSDLDCRALDSEARPEPSAALRSEARPVLRSARSV